MDTNKLEEYTDKVERLLKSIEREKRYLDMEGKENYRRKSNACKLIRTQTKYLVKALTTLNKDLTEEIDKLSPEQNDYFLDFIDGVARPTEEFWHAWDKNKNELRKKYKVYTGIASVRLGDNDRDIEVWLIEKRNKK